MNDGWFSKQLELGVQEILGLSSATVFIHPAASHTSASNCHQVLAVNHGSLNYTALWY